MAQRIISEGNVDGKYLRLQARLNEPVSVPDHGMLFPCIDSRIELDDGNVPQKGWTGEAAFFLNREDPHAIPHYAGTILQIPFLNDARGIELWTALSQGMAHNPVKNAQPRHFSEKTLYELFNDLYGGFRKGTLDCIGITSPTDYVVRFGGLMNI